MCLRTESITAVHQFSQTLSLAHVKCNITQMVYLNVGRMGCAVEQCSCVRQTAVLFVSLRG